MQRLMPAFLVLPIGCGLAEPSPEPSAATPTAETSGPPAASGEAGSPASSPRPESAAELLECDGDRPAFGGRADEFGPEGGGSTADEAFRTWVASTAFGVPRSGYEKLGTIGDRTVYAYRASGEIKVVVVISPRFTELAGAPLTIEELRSCDPSEYGAGVDLGPGRRTWVHETTGALLTDIAGPGHCGWESARMLHVEDDTGVRQYLRDPLGVLSDSPSLLEVYAGAVELPSDAAFSGYRTDDGLELWFVPGDRAAYVVTTDGVERWPRADPPIGCA
jgi:hypothetical protein